MDTNTTPSRWFFDSGSHVYADFATLDTLQISVAARLYSYLWVNLQYFTVYVTLSEL